MKLVLIDRDGVINVEIEGYVKSPQELDIMPAACEALALFRKHGFTCVVVTNQSVVGRNFIGIACRAARLVAKCNTVRHHFIGKFMVFLIAQ